MLCGAQIHSGVAQAAGPPPLAQRPAASVTPVITATGGTWGGLGRRESGGRVAGASPEAHQEATFSVRIVDGW